MSRDRARKVAQHIQEELGRLFSRGVKDPRIGFITLTGVELSPDLRSGKVFYSVLGDEASKKETAQGLKAATPFLKREVAKALALRHVPDLRFVYDESIERGARIEELLREAREKDAGKGGEGEGEG